MFNTTGSIELTDVEIDYNNLNKLFPKEDKSELLPCPFCGYDVEVDEDKFIHEDSLFRIECMGCGIHTSAFDNKQELIEVWNRRVSNENNKTKYEVIIAEMAELLDDHFHCENNRDICSGCEYADEEGFCFILGDRSNEHRPCVKQIIDYYKRRHRLDGD